jgi:hypothetical protein
MIAEIFAILTGLILLTGLLGVIPALGKHLEKFAKWLGSFQGIIGILALIVAIVWWPGLILGIFMIFGGIMLAIGILMAIPALGKYLEKLAKFLGGFQTIIGIVLLIVGIWYLID